MESPRIHCNNDHRSISHRKITYNNLFLPLYKVISAAAYTATTRALKTLNKEDAQLIKEIFGEKTAKLITKIIVQQH